MVDEHTPVFQLPSRCYSHRWSLMCQKQTFYSNYDRHSHELPTLHDGDAENELSLGRVIGEEGPRSFWVDVNGKNYRRNHKWLRSTPEEVEPTVTIQDLTDPSEPVESSSADLCHCRQCLYQQKFLNHAQPVVQCVSVSLQLGWKITSVDTKTLL